MDKKKYEIAISVCNNFYINILKELNIQDLLDIKKKYPQLSIYHLFNKIEMINQIFKDDNIKNFIIYKTEDKQKAEDCQAEYISNNCQIKLSSDELSAKMKINPDADINKIKQEIERIGINYGVLSESIENMKNNRKNDFFIFAKGNPPIDVEETKYAFFYETKRPFPVNIQQGTKGVYLDTTLENRTIKDKTIAKINKSSKGIPGKTFTGITIPTRIHPLKPLELGKNVYEENGEIKPQINGIINYSNETIEIIPTLVIKDPVISQNINFNGTIIIENMVQNSTIKSTHDITIYGTSNSTKLDANGFIYLLTGFVGKSSKATAKKGIFCGYAHNCNLTTLEGDINIGYESLHANLNSEKSIYIEKKASGGKLTAKEKIIMGASGSERISTRTEIFLNYDNDQSKLTLEKLKQQILSNERKYQNATKELSRFELFSEKPRHILIKDSAYQQLMAIVFELQEKLKEQLQILAKSKSYNENFLKKEKTGFILIKENVWNGTSININSENLIIDKNANQASLFRLGNYGIIRERYDKKTSDL